MIIIQSFSELFKELKNLNLANTIKEMSLNLGNYSYLSEMNTGRKQITQEFVQRVNDFYKTDFRLNKIEVKQVESVNFMEVDYISINAQAGYLNAISGSDDQLNELDKMLVPKEFEKGYYMVVEVKGDSMNDGTNRSINAGDKILCKELQKHHWQNKLHIRNNLFVICSPDGIVLKQITGHNTETGVLTCHSWNPLYEDFTVNIEDAYKLFYVKKIIDRQIIF